MNKLRCISHVVFCVSLLMLLIPADGTGSGIISTKHNLSVSGPGDIKATLETRICVFCHAPHNAAPATPLWNKSIQPVNYILYESTTLTAPLSQPYGPTRLCLSCHDGTVALGAVLQPAAGISMTMGTIPQSRSTYIGTFLKGDHPVSFNYYDALANPEIYPTLPSGLNFYGTSAVHCTTCHDPHEDAYKSPDKSGFLTGKFLRVDNRSSALCTKCHIKSGWDLSTHRTSAAQINGILPIAPRNWPTWMTVGEWGCDGCHASHTALGFQRLLYFAKEEDNCYTCHKGNVAQKNIYGQFQKISHHAVEFATGVHDPKESPIMIADHVECVDCHNPHAVNSRIASAPYMPGQLDGVNGVDINGAALTSAVYEYQICLKCHADSTPSILFSPGFPIPRVISTTNARFQFSTGNASFHPVAGQGRSMDVPSIPSLFMPAITATSIIYCMDCHESDESSAIGGSGPRGPHGSIYAPLLREQYVTSDNSPESYQSYALCYRCHDRNSILNNQSFKKHQTHIVNDHAPCSVCHDPHGVKTDLPSGDHTRLINFDTRSVTPIPGQLYPLFKYNGGHSGNCTLVCHGVTHINFSY